MLALLIHAITPVLIVYGLCKLQLKVEQPNTWLAAWLLPIATAVITGNIWLFYLSLIALSAIIPKSYDSRVYFYLALFCALPKLGFLLPFPGVNYLMKMTYPFFLGLVLLVPLYFGSHRNSLRLSGLDKFVAAYLVLTLLLDLRGHGSITNSMRAIVTMYLGVWVPYIIIANNKNELAKNIQAIFLVGVVLAFEALLEWGVVWKIYVSITRGFDGVALEGFSGTYYFRGFGLRVASSWLDPITFGMFMASCCFIAMNMQKIGFNGRMVQLLLVVVTFLALLFTDSRGAMLVLLVALTVALYFRYQNRAWKNTLKLMVVVGAVLMFTNLETLYELDSSGTFKYRADLITYSEDAFKSAPILGDPNFRQNKTLIENMTQGQGIVDMVNHYLRVTLRYGLFGLFLYLAMWITAITAVASRVSELQAKSDSRADAGIVLVSVMLGTAVVIYTVSLMGYMREFIFILIALSSAFIKNTEDAEATKRFS